MVKSQLWNRLSDENLDRLLCIAIERPELKKSVDFEEVLDSFKQTNCRVRL